MSRRVCLSIGVATVLPVGNSASKFSFLEGAPVSAQMIGDWALRAGFSPDDVRVVHDDSDHGGQPVTRERIHQAVSELFPPGAQEVEHLIVTFCGHGLTDSNFDSIHWLFSDSLTEKYRVVVDRFREELLLHGPRRITLISDACRDGPGDLELSRLDAVRGIIVHGQRLADSKRDLLSACQDGRQGYMVFDPRSALSGKCVFSGVVIDALWGHEPTAIVDGVITTSSLGACLSTRVTERASQYGLQMNPYCAMDPRPSIVYDSNSPPAGPAVLQPWPPTKASLALGPAAASAETEFITIADRLQHDTKFREEVLGSNFGLNEFKVADRIDFKRLIGSSDIFQEILELRDEGSKQPEVQEQLSTAIKKLEVHAVSEVRRDAALELREKLEFPYLRPRSDIEVWDKSPKIWSHSGSVKERTGRPLSSFLLGESDKQILVELSDGSMIPVAIYEDLYATVVQSALGEAFVSYGNRYLRRSYGRQIEVLEALAAGTLGSYDVDFLASELRDDKHIDPTLGVLSAYLYRIVGDLDSIRRMAYFYCAHGQPIPYDIALLGEIMVARNWDGEFLAHVPSVNARAGDSPNSRLASYVTRATSTAEGRVGGRCPWLALGWDYVSDPSRASATLVEGLGSFARDIRRNGYTALSAEAGRELAKLWKLRSPLGPATD